MEPPPEITRGPGWLCAWLNWLRAFVISIQPLRSSTIDYQDHPSGRQLEATAKGGGSSGAASALKLFQLIATESGSANKIRVTRSLLAGAAPDGFNEADDPPFLLSPSGTSGVVYAKITVAQNSGAGGGEISARSIEVDSTVPEDTDTDYHLEIGTYSVEDDVLTVQNSIYGPIEATVCRNAWAAESPFYGVSMTGATG